MVKTAVVLPLRVAVIVALLCTGTANVVTVNVAVVTPAATITFGGTVALTLFDARVTTIPPVGAGVLMVTVPVDDRVP